MRYGASEGGIIVPESMSPRPQVTAISPDNTLSYRSREFHPDNPAARKRQPEESYLEQLHLIDPDLELTWHPIEELWQVWVRDLSIGRIDATAYCRGWRLLFTLRERATGRSAPLDNRLFALLYAHDVSRFGGGMKFYAELKRREYEADRLMDKAKWHISQETARGLWDHLRPSVGYGKQISASKVG